MKLFFIIFLVNQCYSNVIFHLITTHLQENNVQICYFFTCWTKNENIELLKLTNRKFVRISFALSESIIKQVLPLKNITKYGFVLDLSCPKSKKILENETIPKNFANTYPWLILTNQTKTFKDTKNFFKNTNLRLDSSFTIAMPLRNDKIFRILEIYNPGFKLTGAKPIIQEIGIWNRTYLLDGKSFYERRKKLCLLKIRSAMVLIEKNYPGKFTDYMLDPRFKRIDTVSKFHYALFLILQDIHQFRAAVDKLTNIKPSAKLNNILRDILNQLSILSREGREMMVVWIKDHSGIEGNDNVDKLAHTIQTYDAYNKCICHFWVKSGTERPNLIYLSYGVDQKGFIQKHKLIFTNTWFGNLSSGIDAGIGKLLVEDKIDISSSGGFQRPDRMDYVNWIQPSYHFKPIYIFRNPKSYNPFCNEFLKPFSGKTWVILSISAMIISIFLKIALWSECKFFGVTIRYSWASVILVTVSTIFQQGSSLIPSYFVGRTIFLSLLLMSVLIYNYYTSTIISILLNTHPTTLTTLTELGHSDLKIGIQDLPYVRSWFLQINTSDVQYIYKHKVYPPGSKGLRVFNPEEGIAKVKQGGFAYHTLKDTGYPLISKTFDQDAICDLVEIKMLPSSLSGHIIQKKSQYLDLFHISMRKMKQAGLIKRIELIWESEKPKCMANARILSVGASQTFIAFLALILGTLISLFLLVLEIIWLKMDWDKQF